MTSLASKNSILKDKLNVHRLGGLFFLLCIWTYVVLCRPQDIFLFLVPFRPALVMGLLTLGFTIIHFRYLQGPPFFKERQIKYYSALIVVMVIGIPMSIYRRLSFEFIFMGYINAIIFVFVFYKLIDSVKKLSIILLIACLGNGFYSAFAVITGTLGENRLSFGTMFDPNDLAYFALGFLPLNLVFISRENPIWVRLTCFGCFFLSLLLILLTGSRGGMIALCLVITLFIFQKTKTIRGSIKIIFIGIFLVSFSLSSINLERYMTILNLEDDYNVKDETGRLSIWKIGARAMLSNPLTGVGVGCFGEAVGLDRQKRGAETLRWQTAHNSAIQIGAETGIIGLTLFLLLTKNVFVVFYQVKKSSAPERLIKISEMGFIGFAGLFTASMFLSQAYSVYWAFYVAISAVVNQLQVKYVPFEVKK